MSEYNPEAPVRLRFENEEIELPLKTTSAYTYRELGYRAISHLWIEDNDENGVRFGSRIWFDQFGVNDETREDTFVQTLQAMANYGYEMHLNLLRPQESDLEAYVGWQSRLGGDTVPEGWE